MVTLKGYNSLRIGGEGLLVTVHELKELTQVAMYARAHGLSLMPLGEGTNTFFGDDLSKYLFVKMALRGISLEDQGDQVLVTACAGEIFDDVIAFAVDQGLWGIENLSYIPGTVGAAPVQNIGAYGVELKDTFVSLTALDTVTLNVVSMTQEACNFSYRDSLFKHEKGKYIIISVSMLLSKIPHPVLTYKPLDTFLNDESLTLARVRACVIETRTNKLPDYRTYPNAGSFFKNPIITLQEGERLKAKYDALTLIETKDGYKVPAAWLIEHIAEMKGVQVGNIGAWPKQPLVLVNYAEGSKDELLAFAETIVQKVFQETGITLEKEVNCIG